MTDAQKSIIEKLIFKRFDITRDAQNHVLDVNTDCIPTSGVKTLINRIEQVLEGTSV